MFSEDLYYELEEMLTLGFKNNVEYERYIELKDSLHPLKMKKDDIV
ncbi:DUF5962 family protein [Streptococcus pluranimalium]